MTPVLESEAELYFERGGPIQRFAQRLALRWGFGHSIRSRILGFLAVTWLPLVVFALLEGRALTSSPRDSLLLDFGTYARFFVAVPLLLMAESIVGPRLRSAGIRFVQGGFVGAEDQPAFEQSIARVSKLRESTWAEVIIVSIAVIGAWNFTTETVYGEGLSSWRSITRVTNSGAAVSLTGLWNSAVAVPMLQFFWYRWMWRLLIWGLFLWDVSRLNLNLVATHADQAGGLGFLGTAHASLGIFAAALSAVLSAEVAFLVIFRNANISAFQLHYLATVLIIEVLILGPLLMFVPILIRARQAALRDYGLLVGRYNRAFHDKWILGGRSSDEPLLGSADIQSLADLGNSFELVREMKVVPFSQRVVFQLAMVTSLPCIPLILLVVPINTILELLTKAVF